MAKHPKGLFPLFFTEMWERLAFYLMLGILVLYATDKERGGLGLTAGSAAEIYGTYLAFVYFTPFLGGMIADRFLGFRRSVFIGGLMMAAGLFCLAKPSLTTFYSGLVLLCLGNGLFKPNISAMVGNLYTPDDPNRDSGFNIFYMGINIGATLAAILAAPLRNKWGFNWAFFAAGVGLVIGVIILSINWKKLAKADRRSEKDPDDVSFGKIMMTIVLPGVACGVGGYFLGFKIPLVMDTIKPATFGFIVGMLPIFIYFAILVRTANDQEKPGLAALMPVFIAGGTFFMILHLSGGLMTFFTEDNTKRRAEWIPEFMSSYKQKAMPSYFKNADPELPRPDERMMVVVDETTATYFGSKRISDQALDALVAGLPDLLVLDTEKDEDRIQSSWSDLYCKVFGAADLKVKEETGAHGEKLITVDVSETATALRSVMLAKRIDDITCPVILLTQETFDQVYEGASDARVKPGEFVSLINAELIVGFLNPVFVVLLTPLIVAFFAWRVRKKKPVGTAHKIFYGLIITVISIAIMAFAAYLGGNGENKTGMSWLVIYYLIITVGELCLSPMGLSLVTKLSPKRLVGLMMGGWFLSTSVGNKLAGFISGLPPTYGMFITLSLLTLLVAIFILVLLPWMDRTIKKYGA